MPRNRLPLIAAGVVGILLVFLLRNVFGGDRVAGRRVRRRGQAPRGLHRAGRLPPPPRSRPCSPRSPRTTRAADRRASGRCVDVKRHREGLRRRRGGAGPRLGRGRRRPPPGRLVAGGEHLARPAAGGPDPRRQADPARPRRTRASPDAAGARHAAADGPGAGLAEDAASAGRTCSRSASDPHGLGQQGPPRVGQVQARQDQPDSSTSGLAATVGTFVAATGRSSDLTSADLADPKIRAFATAVESSVVHYGDTTLTFLANLQRADDAGPGR